VITPNPNHTGTEWDWIEIELDFTSPFAEICCPALSPSSAGA